MPVIYAGGGDQGVTLEPGLTMTVTSGDIQSAGTVYHVSASGAGQQAIPPNSTRVFGPYNAPRHYRFAVSAGHLSYSLAMPAFDYATQQGNIESFVGNLTLKIEDMGKILRCDDTSNVTVTAPANLPAGFNVGFAMWNTGTVTIAAQNGATNRSSKTALSTQYQAGSLIVVKNATGAAAEYLLVGDFA